MYDHPKDAFSAGFLGEANWLPESRLGSLSLPGDPAGRSFAVRPEALTIGAVPEGGRNSIRGG
ncbi:hypothetical protein HORIV_23480 [Vreelandella olivaria]|uniref:Uncharacterized protein n=1 Tax=Vreelandella olivaria TaxID=390919 RepID=A0ABM7GH67_9GAMM|nr:hypothetical protein HORIV_23480 [Halomonas olivaria]